MQHRNALQTAHRIALDYLEGLDQAPALATASLGELRGRFSMPLPESGMDAATVIKELADQAQGGVLGSSGGRFFGWVIGGNVPS